MQATRPISFNSAHSEKQIKQYRVEQFLNNQKAALEFMESLLGYSIKDNNVHLCLKDGIMLCEMLNIIKPGIIKQISKAPTPFNQMSNIFSFLNAATKLGLEASELFETVDLYEGKDMARVYLTILAIARKLCKLPISSRSNSNRNSDKSNKTSPITNELIFNNTNQNITNSSQESVKQDIVLSPTETSPEIDFKKEIVEVNKIQSKVISSPLENNFSILRNKEPIINKNEKRRSMLPITTNKEFIFEGDTKINNRKSMMPLLNNDNDNDNDTFSNLFKIKPNNKFKVYTPPASPISPITQDKMKNLRQMFDPKYNQPINDYVKQNKKTNLTDIKIEREKSNSTPNLLNNNNTGKQPKLPIKSNSDVKCKHLDNINGKEEEFKEDSGVYIETNEVPIALDRVRKPTNHRIIKGGLIEDLDLSIKKSNIKDFRNDVLRLDNIDWDVDNDNSFISRSESILSIKTTNNLRVQNQIGLKKSHSRNYSENIINNKNNINNSDNELTNFRPRADSDSNKVYKNDRISLINPNTKIIIQYQLGDCLGKGQFGTVYKALNMKTGQISAVKRIELEQRNKIEIEALMNEVDLLKSLSHNNIINYEGYIKSNSYLDIILEFVENGSLQQLLRSYGYFSPTLVCSYTSQILEGLIYLHAKEVVHCDLKAANILTTKNGKVKLTDFGVSLNLNIKSSEQGEIVAGTPNWMAPEVISLKGASTASDIWSLGCTIIELLTGKPPYSELNAMTALFRIVEDDCPPLPQDLTKNLKDFLLSCFKKDPTSRPTAEELFFHDWIIDSQLAKEFGEIELNEKDKKIEETIRDNQITDSLWRTCYPLTDNPLITSPDSTTSMRLPDQHNIAVQEHQFVKSSFEKPILCKVCKSYIKKQAMLCDDCGLICHTKCVKQATTLCQTRSEPILPNNNIPLVRSPIKKHTPLNRPLYSRKYSNRRGFQSEGAIASNQNKFSSPNASPKQHNLTAPWTNNKDNSKVKKKKNDDCKIS